MNNETKIAKLQMENMVKEWDGRSMFKVIRIQQKLIDARKDKCYAANLPLQTLIKDIVSLISDHEKTEV